MDARDVRQRIAEYARTRPDAAGDPEAQVEAALFVEQVFGITLTDADMNADTLGSAEAMERFVLDRLGVK